MTPLHTREPRLEGPYEAPQATEGHPEVVEGLATLSTHEQPGGPVRLREEGEGQVTGSLLDREGERVSVEPYDASLQPSRAGLVSRLSSRALGVWLICLW